MAGNHDTRPRQQLSKRAAPASVGMVRELQDCVNELEKRVATLERWVAANAEADEPHTPPFPAKHSDPSESTIYVNLHNDGMIPIHRPTTDP